MTAGTARGAGRARVLLLGFDALDPELVLRWAQDGLLPAFRNLMERGSFGPTGNPRGLLVGAVWPSFFTGTLPIRHGRYCYEQIIPGTYRVRRFYTSDLRREPFWVRLSDAGRRIAVVDVPKSPLTPQINGIQLVDWGTHDPELDSPFRTAPPSLAAEVRARFGRDPVGDCNHIGRGAAGISAFRRNLEARIRTKTAMCREFLGREDWDLFLGVFAESHCVGHQCWALHDPSFAGHQPGLVRAVGDPLKAVYVALDAALGSLLQEAPAESTVIVLASHGMGPHYDASFMLEDILERLDPHPGMWRRRLTRWSGRYVHALKRRLWWGREPSRKLPVGRRRVFAIPNNDVFGAIRVNLVGREPHGVVTPGQEYDSLFDDLRCGLKELINAETGAALVRDVFRVAEDPLDERALNLPDFCIEWNRDAPIRSVASPRIGVIRRRFRGVRNGDHKPNGFFWATGPGIAGGQPIGPVSVTDLAATVAALLDVPLDDIDGRPIPALVP